MKKLRNLKQSLLGKSIFKRLRNTINPNNAQLTATSSIAGSIAPNYSGKKKIFNLLESSSVYVINAHETTNAATHPPNANCNGTISTSSLISKCPTKKYLILNKKQSDHENLSEFDRIAIANANNEDMTDSGEFYQIYFSHYIGHTVISYDTNLNGSATNFISKIIDTVNFKSNIN
jgi:hypothetical protein